MAQESKDSSKSAAPKKAAPAAKPAPKTAKPEKAAKSADAKAGTKAKGKATPSVADGGVACRAEKCKQPVRAKGLCRKHYIAWRRGEMGDHHRYKVCSKEGCRKPRTKGGLCDEHAGVAAPEAAAPAEGAPAA